MVMDAMPLNGSRSDDPRRLRELIHKASSFAAAYDVTSVMVGMSGVEGDLMFPEMVDYVGSALRIDDGIFRLTRERVIFFLADADRQRAEEIMERLLVGFREHFTPSQEQRVSFGYFEVTPEMSHLTVRDVLPALFESAPTPVAH
jgi:hypothetical protein